MRSLRCAGVSVWGLSRTSLVLLSTPPLSIRSTASSSVLTPWVVAGPLSAAPRGSEFERAHQPFHVWRDRLIARAAASARSCLGPCQALVCRTRCRRCEIANPRKEEACDRRRTRMSRRPGTLVRSLSSPPRPNPAALDPTGYCLRESFGRSWRGPSRSDRRSVVLVLFLESLDGRGTASILRHGVGIAAHLTTPPRSRLESLRPAIPEVRIEGDPIHRRRMPRVLPSNRGDSARPSVQPFSGTWHVSHDIFFVLDRRVSKKSFAERNSPCRQRIVRWDCDGQGFESWPARSRVEPSGRQPSAPAAFHECGEAGHSQTKNDGNDTAHATAHLYAPGARF